MRRVTARGRPCGASPPGTWACSSRNQSPDCNGIAPAKKTASSPLTAGRRNAPFTLPGLPRPPLASGVARLDAGPCRGRASPTPVSLVSYVMGPCSPPFPPTLVPRLPPAPLAGGPDQSGEGPTWRVCLTVSPWCRLTRSSIPRTGATGRAKAGLDSGAQSQVRSLRR